MVSQDRDTQEPEADEEQVYRVGRLPQSELEAWLNEQANNGYQLKDIWMVQRGPDDPVFSVLMVLAE